MRLLHVKRLTSRNCTEGHKSQVNQASTMAKISHMVGLHVARDLFLCQTNMRQEQLILSSAEDMYVIPICFTSYFRIICFFLLSDDFRSNIVFYLLFAYSSKMAVYIGHFEVFNIQ